MSRKNKITVSWTCTECQKTKAQFETTDTKTFIEHLKKVHSVNTKEPMSKNLVFHMTGRTFSSYAYNWKTKNDIEFSQSLTINKK